MLDLSKVARPYAEAVFDYAREQKQVPAWSERLNYLAEIVREPLVNKVLRNPKPTSKQLADICIDLTNSKLDTAGENLIKILAYNKRLLLLPEIAKTYQTLRAISEKVLHVNVRSAVLLTKKYQQQLKKALSEKLNHEITLKCQVDEKLIGGLIIKAGDTVIDNSIIGQLSRWQVNLTR